MPIFKQLIIFENQLSAMRKMLFVLFAGILFLGCKKNDDGTVTVVPISPTELKATVISTTQVNLSWIDKSTNEDGFKIQRKTGTGNFADVATVSKDVTTYSDNGLTPATTYTYRVFAYNSTGASLSYTNEVTVTTFGSAVLTTTAISNISNTTAKSGGSITSDGGSPITARGIVWSTSANPTIALTTKTIDGTGTGTFTSNLTGLTANTTYYVRAYATNIAGTSYGNEVSFKTLNVDITSGLVGWWPFNGNANDESGNGNNGTVNGATLTSDRFGNTNKAYSFDGNDDNIHVGQLNLTSDYSVSFWIYLNNSNFQYPIGFGINQFNTVDVFKGYGIGYSSLVPPCPGLGNSKYFVYDGVSTCNSWIECNSQSSPFQWNNVVITKNGSSVRVFIDGAIDTSGTNLNLNGIIDLYFGVRSDLFAFFNGHLDDIRIYNRALTQEEITYLYNN